MSHHKLGSTLVFCLFATAVQAQSQQKGPSNLSIMQSGFSNVSTVSPGNAGGLLSYCVTHKHLGAQRAATVLNSLKTRPGLSTSSGYLLGQQGIIVSAHRRQMTFSEIPKDLKGQACEAVLKRGSTALTETNAPIASRPTTTAKGN